MKKIKEGIALLFILLRFVIPGVESKGGGRSPRPLCRFKGVRGEIEIPPRFSLGGRGDILFSKENIPLASPYRNGTVPPGIPVSLRQRFLLLALTRECLRTF